MDRNPLLIISPDGEFTFGKVPFCKWEDLSMVISKKYQLDDIRMAPEPIYGKWFTEYLLFYHANEEEEVNELGTLFYNHECSLYEDEHRLVTGVVFIAKRNCGWFESITKEDLKLIDDKYNELKEIVVDEELLCHSFNKSMQF